MEKCDELDLQKLSNLIIKESKLEAKTITIDLNSIMSLSPKVYEEILESPKDSLVKLKSVLSQFFPNDFKVHLANINNTIEINKIRVQEIGKLVSLKGIIKRITKVIPRVSSIGFECPDCGTIIKVIQEKKTTREPTKCTCGRKGGFIKVSESMKDIQEINLEEMPEESAGKQPQQIRVYLEDELTDKTLSSNLQPGRKIEVIGTIEKLPAFMNPKDVELNLSEFMVNANNIISLEEDDEVYLDEETEKQIIEISSTNPLKKLSESLVPEIYGNEIIKEAIVLQLVKGVAKERSDGTYSQEDIHILLSGDPGVSKSVTLKSVASKTPKARMVVGTKTSRVGLGAMAVKDELSNSWSLECGNLVLASGSILCLDELDKMNKENLSELLEPMSAGTVTIAKAGISAKLSARTGILASANPIEGNFDLSQPLAKQLDLPSPILNRFDLIFIMLDKPNKDFDSKAIEHVFGSMLEKREPEIDNQLFKKYIFYCRKLQPKLKPELLESLKSFYNNLRRMSFKGNERYVPINLRNMEGLIRLSEASAKIRLSENVEKEDFETAKRIFMHCLKQIGIDNETGMVDYSRVTEKFPVSKRGKMQKIMDLISDLSVKYVSKNIPYEEVLEESKKLGISKMDLDISLEQMKRENLIFEPESGVFKIL